MSDGIVGSDIYFRRVYKDGPGPVMVARVWDREKFMDAEVGRGESEKDPKDRYRVQGSSAEDYRKVHWKVKGNL